MRAEASTSPKTKAPNGVLGSSISRWPFLAAVALIAAAVSDLLVEAIANTGAFGQAFFDTDDACIVPSLAVAVCLALAVIAGHARAASRRSNARGDRLAAVARDLAVHAPLRDAPYIFGMQFAAVFAIENIERLAASGRPAEGLLWLGGPPAASIAVHLAVGLASALCAGWLMRVSARHVATLVCCALEFVLCARGLKVGAVYVARRDAESCSHARAVGVRHISGRAPPLSPVPV